MNKIGQNKNRFCRVVDGNFFCMGCMSEGASEPESRAPENIRQEISVDKPQLPRQELIVYSSPAKYSYENFLSDVNILRDKYPTQMQVVKLCDTADGRGVFDIVLGDLNAANHILIFGAMHAREYITVQVVMRQLCESLDALNNRGNYRGVPVSELLEGLAIHFVPNSNPDGVAISQFGLNALNNPALRARVAAMGSSDYEQWKANANGVDLNRNFDAGWYEFVGSPAPSTERYKGTAPGSEPEAAALIALTKNYPVKRTISYHTCGALIYWYYKQSGTVLTESEKFAKHISAVTGYPLDDDYTAVDAAGFKDWAVYKAGIPGLTIEVGAESGGLVNPVPQSRFNAIWNRNKDVVYATAYNLKFE